MTRQLVLLDPASVELERLPQPENVWELGYMPVMATPSDRPLHRFWRHYHGAIAEMAFSGDSLMALQQDIAAVLHAPQPLPAAVQTFLQALQRLCDRARQCAAVLEVLAD